ncbi:MAG: hypothetical protein J5449_13120, partial [Oscillospiraceae bacterium]|nr:hypothetical protein [Oscillospiraceae bacterium]
PKKERRRRGKKGDEAAEGAEGTEEGGEKRRQGNPMILLIIIIVPVIIITSVATVLIVLKPWQNKNEEPAADPTQISSEQGEQSELGESDTVSGNTAPSEAPGIEDATEPKDGEQGDGEEQSGEDVQTTPTTTPSTPASQPLSTVEALDLFGDFSPESLGLSGESMAEYHYYTTGKNVKVDGMYCIEIMVYSENESADTNDYAGRYFLSKGTVRKLFRDEGNGVIVELSPSVIGLDG